MEYYLALRMRRLAAARHNGTIAHPAPADPRQVLAAARMPNRN
jgi:hypothetical protein